LSEVTGGLGRVFHVRDNTGVNVEGTKRRPTLGQVFGALWT